MLRLYSVTIIYVTLFTTKYIFVADENEPRFRRLRSLFKDPMTEVYLLFYQSSLQAFINFNMFLQREDPIIPVVHEQTTSFLRKLGSKFLTVAAIIRRQMAILIPLNLRKHNFSILVRYTEGMHF